MLQLLLNAGLMVVLTVGLMSPSKNTHGILLKKWLGIPCLFRMREYNDFQFGKWSDLVTCRSGEHRSGLLAAFSCFCVKIDFFDVIPEKNIA